MKAAEKTILTAFLEKTLNFSAEKVAPLFKENGDESELQPEALNELLTADAARVQGFKANEKTMFDNGFKKAQSEVLSKTEKDIKDEFGVTSEKTGIDLLKEIISTKTPTDKKIDADTIKVHPEFLKLESEWKKQAKIELEAKGKEFEDYKTEVSQKETFNRIAKKADEYLSKLKPILTNDPVKAANQKQLLINELKGFTFQENGDEIIVMKDGKRFEDAHGKPISLETLVKEKSGQYWDFKDGGHHSGTGADNNNANPNQGNNANSAKSKYTGELPKNETDFHRIFPTLKAEDRIEFSKHEAVIAIVGE